MEKFLMIFNPKGPKEPSVDASGNSVYQLWKIHDKWNRDDGSSLYEVQFWEDFKDKNEIYYFDEEFMNNRYGEMVGKWEALYGEDWKQKYGELGHILNSKDERSVSTPKRGFEDTPSKSRSIEKKSRSGNSSISGGNNTGNSPVTGDTHPKSGNRYTSMPTSFSPASRSENSPISGGNDSNVSNPSLANTSRPNNGNAYTLLPPPLLPESSQSSRRLATTQQGNVGLSGNSSVPSRFTRRLASRSSGPVEQSARDLTSKTGHLESPSTSRQPARRIPTSYPSSLGQSAKSPISSSNQSRSVPVIGPSAEHSKVRFSPLQSEPLDSPDPMDIDTEIQPAEQLRESRYRLYYSKFDDDFEEMVDKFDERAFKDIINSILEKTGDELAAIEQEAIDELGPDGNVQMVDVDGGEYAENPGMILDAYSDRLIEAHSKGLRELVDAALDLEGLPCDKWVNKRKEDGNLEVMKLELLFMSACIHPDVLKHLVQGDLPKAYSDPSMISMRAHMASMMEGHKKEKRIFIYIHYLVNEIGVPPSPSKLEHILNIADIYIRGFGKPNDQASYQISKKIDEVVGNHKAEPDGKRRYIKGNTQYKVINEWISLVRKRIEFDQFKNRWDEPLSRPISEVGFASSLQRLDQHRKHVSSNYIMNLIEAIFATEGGIYKNHQYVIFNCVEPCHGTFGEILCSRYAQAYSSHGGGFSHFVAGVDQIEDGGVIHGDEVEKGRME
ncbi:hypothetical protein EAE99_010304 [Botrytis elliptica]|nr:hypothetical protein EAE99_010304 [Botrytis elliptica]